MREGDLLPSVHKQVTQDQIERYAAASGDFNPVHVDPEFAARSQFGRTIAHGMLVATSISEMMTLAFQEQWLQTGRLKIRFRAPAYPGDTLTAFGQVQSIRLQQEMREIVCTVGVRKSDGEAAITGEASVTAPLVP